MTRKQRNITAIAFIIVCRSAVPAAIAAEVSGPVTARFEEVGTNAARITLSATDVRFERVETADGLFDLVTVEGEPTTARAGYPDLPLVARTVVVPPRAGVRFEIEAVDSRVVRGVRPVIAPRELPDGTFEPMNASVQYLATDTFWPSECAEIGEPAILRGVRLVTVRFFPVQFNPVTGEARVNENIRVRLVYEGEPVNPIEDTNPKPSLYVSRLLEGAVLNLPRPPARDDVQHGSYLYIIPIVNGIDAEIAPLLEWRRRQGHRVRVMRVANNTLANVIRDSILAAYRSPDPCEFVALVGEATAGASLIINAPTQTGDYQYTLLDGNDPLPDIALGRISCTTLAQLRTIVGKIVPYESTPNMQNTNWYLQGAVVAGHVGNGISEVFTAKYVRKQMYSIGYQQVRSWLWPENGEIGQDDRNQPFISQCFEWGVSCFFYRAFSRMNSLPINVLYDLRNRSGIFPAVLAISCNTGTFVAEDSYSEAFLKSQGGGIGAIGTATPNTNVRFNNLVITGIWKGMYLDSLWCMGWGLNAGKYEIWRAYAGFDNEYLNFMEWNNLMGDPGTHVWSGIPRRINVTHSQTHPVASNSYTVIVADNTTGEPEAGARVCLWRENQFQTTLETDNNGRVDFQIPEGVLGAGVVKLTVTKHNVVPYLADVNVSAQVAHYGVDGWEVDDEEGGDGDGLVNPGETVNIEAQIRNYTNQQLFGNATVRLASLSPWAVTAGEPVVLEQLPDAGRAVPVTLSLRIDPACPDGKKIQGSVSVRYDNSVWTSLIDIEVVAPRIRLDSLNIAGAGLLPGEVKDIDFILSNIGRKRMEPFRAFLESGHPDIEIIAGERNYRGLNSGYQRGAGDDLFRLRAHPLTLPGTVVPLTLMIESETGFRDTVSTSITVGAAGNNDPLGPDRYGYACWDSGDQGWDQTPVYEWIEINPNINPRNFNGSVIANLTDTGDNDDKSRMINLPFVFQYYGREYNTLTVCTNGWAAFGDETEFADFRNQHIGQALGPSAMLAVWWDNLITVQGSAICSYHDQNGGRFIVEWSGMRRLLDGGIGAVETFQLILYDVRRHATETGDGIIVYQYKEVTNENARARNDIPYCTIAIQSPDLRDGLEYTYWNVYPRGARAIASRMALKFTTSRAYRMGVLTGRVVDIMSGEPVDGAEVKTGEGYFGLTDEDGVYRIENVRVGEGQSVTVRATGWNDSTRGGINIAEDQITEVNFALYHPTFELNIQQIETTVSNGDAGQFNLTLTNRGNGRLNWSASRRLRSEAARPPWTLRESLSVGQTVNDDRIEGVVFVNEHFYVSGAAGNDPNTIYIFDREGDFTDAFDQHGNSVYGMKDLDWDGELIWGSGERTVFGFTPEGELVRTVDGTVTPITGVAWDSDRNILWVAGITSNIFGVDLDGNRVNTIVRGDLRIYGLAYYPEEPLRRGLYVYCQEVSTARQQLFNVNPEERVLRFVTYLDPPQGGTARGMEISNSWDPYNWTFVSISNASNEQGGDRIDIYEIAPRSDWMRITPSEGSLEPDGRQQLTLTLDATRLPVSDYEGEVVFRHNAAGGRTIVPVLLGVVPGEGARDTRLLSLMQGWNMISINVEPANLAVESIVLPLTEAGVLQLMKSGTGAFYAPGDGFNNIGNWSVTEGYCLYLSAPSELAVPGVIVAGDREIELEAGWNLVAYLPRQPAFPEGALEGIAGQLIIVKDGAGRFYLPEWGFSNLGLMREGAGYQIKVREDVQLVYSSGRLDSDLRTALAESRYFKASDVGGDNLSLLALGDPAMAGWELAVMTGGNMVAGCGVFSGDGVCGVAVWGDNRLTELCDGFTDGEAMRFRVWNGSEESEAVWEAIEGEAKWEKDAVVVGRVSATTAAKPVSFGLGEPYPNPFNASVRLTFGLVTAGTVELALFDMNGRQVATIIRGERGEGVHSVVWSGAHLPSGVYLARLTAGDRTDRRKVVLIR